MLLGQATASDLASSFFGVIFFFGFCALVVGAGIWFFRGPAQAADNYVDGLALQLGDANDAALFKSIYATKGPKSTTLAWLLTVFLSPTISYIYQGKWALALISFITFQGLGLWWLVSIFTMPSEVMAMNKRLADEAYQQVALRRSTSPQQIVNVHQYAYMPPPGTPQATPETRPSGDPGSEPTSPEVPRSTSLSPTVHVTSDPEPPPGTSVMPTA